MRTLLLAAAPLALTLAACATTSPTAEVERAEVEADLEYPTYDQRTIVGEAGDLFGQASAEIAEVISDVFADQGRPQAYIAGEEVGASVGVGVTYGRGMLYRPGAEPVEVYWQGPSVGVDAGADASKVFALVYDLGDTENLYRRIPGGEGDLYVVGGVAAKALTNGDLTIVPVKSGVGARVGVNVNYLHFSADREWIPF